MSREHRLPISLGLGGSLTWVLLHNTPSMQPLLYGILAALIHTLLWEVADVWNQVVWLSARGLPHLHKTVRVGKATVRRLLRPTLADGVIVAIGVLQVYSYITYLGILKRVLTHFGVNWTFSWDAYIFLGVFGLLGSMSLISVFVISLTHREESNELLTNETFWSLFALFNPYLLTIAMALVIVGGIVFLCGCGIFYVWEKREVEWALVVLSVSFLQRKIREGLSFVRNVIVQSFTFVGRLCANIWFYVQADALRTCFVYALGVGYCTLWFKQNSETEFFLGLLICFMFGVSVGYIHNYFKSKYHSFFQALLALVY